MISKRFITKVWQSRRKNTKHEQSEHLNLYLRLFGLILVYAMKLLFQLIFAQYIFMYILDMPSYQKKRCNRLIHFRGILLVYVQILEENIYSYFISAPNCFSYSYFILLSISILFAISILFLSENFQAISKMENIYSFYTNVPRIVCSFLQKGSLVKL